MISLAGGSVSAISQNAVKHGHHYVMVHVNGSTLEIRFLDWKLLDFCNRKQGLWHYCPLDSIMCQEC